MVLNGKAIAQEIKVIAIILQRDPDFGNIIREKFHMPEISSRQNLLKVDNLSMLLINRQAY